MKATITGAERPIGGTGDRAGRAAAIGLSALAVAAVAFGLIADAAGLGLGAPLPPFFVTWDPDIAPAAALWLALFAGAALAALPLARRAPGPVGFALGATAIALIARLALAAAREGTAGWYSMFGLDPEAANEYLPALPALDLGVGTFLDRFAELAPSLPIHPSAHPPGTLLLLDLLSIDGPRGMATLVIVAGVAAVPLTYLLARRLGLAEPRARTAALLIALSPAAMIYGVSSADALFATLGLIALIPLLAPGLSARLLGSLALTLASFFSWALLAIGAFAAILVALRDGLARAIVLASLAGITLLGFYILLWALSGYDSLGVLAAANEAYELGISNARPWAFWVLGSPVAFFVALGLPISWYAARALGRGNEIALALAAIVVIAALLGFSKGETERIWLFMAPLACLAAASIMPPSRLPAVIALLAGQAVAIELTLETVW